LEYIGTYRYYPGMGTYWGNHSSGRLTHIRSAGKE
jgi:hypothetical protein